MASKFLAVVLALATALFPGVQALSAAGFDAADADLSPANITSVKLSLGQIDQLISTIQSGAGASLGRGLSQEDLNKMLAYLNMLKTEYADSGGALTKGMARNFQANAQTLLSAIKSGKGVDLAIAKFYGGTTEDAEAVQEANTTPVPISSHGDVTYLAMENKITHQKVAYRQIIQEDAVVSLVIQSLPDSPIAGKRTVDFVDFVGQEGAAQVLHPLYSLQMEHLLLELKQMYYDNPYGLKDKIAKASKSAQGPLNAEMAADQNVFPKEILSYLANLEQIKGEPGGLAGHEWTDADYQSFERVAQLAQGFYAKQQNGGLEKRALGIFTSYIAMMTNSNPVQEKDGLQEGGLDAELMPQLQKALTSFEQGHLAGYKMALSWLHDTRVNYADWPDKLNEQAEDIVADLGYASESSAKAFDHTTASGADVKSEALDDQEKEADLQARNGWLNLANLQILSFQVKMIAISIAKLKYGDTRGHLGIQGDQQMQAEADRLISGVKDYLKEIDGQIQQAQNILLEQAVSGFYLDLQNAQMAYLYGDALKNQVLDMAAKLREMKSLYLSMQFDKSYLRKADETSDMSGNAYKNFLAHLPQDVAQMAAAMDALGGELSGIAANPDAQAVRQALWPEWKKFSDIAAKLKFAKIPDASDVDKAAKASGLQQTKLMQAAQKFAMNMDMFERMNQANLILLENASTTLVPGVDTHFYSKGSGRIGNVVISNGARAINAVASSASWLINLIPHPAGTHYTLYTVAGVPMLMDVPESSTETHIQATYDSVTYAGIEHGGGAAIAKVMRAMGDDVYWKPEVFKNFVENSDLRDQLLKDLRAGDFSGAQAVLAQIDPDDAKQAWNQHEAEKMPDNNLDNLDIEKFVSQAPDDQALIESEGAMQGIQEQLKPIIMAYQAVSTAIDAVVMTGVTAGFGSLLGTGLRVLGEAVTSWSDAIGGVEAVDTATDALEAGDSVIEGADATADAANLSEGATDVGSLRRGLSSVGSFVGKHLTSWGEGLRATVGLSEIKNGASPSVIMRQMIQKSAKFTVGTSVTMAVVSGGISGVDYAMHPQTSNAKNFSDAALEGTIGGAKFGAGSAPLFLMMPQAGAFGTGVVGDTVRAVANTPGPVDFIARFAMENIPGAAGTDFGKAILDKGVWGSIGALGDSPVLRLLTENTAHFGAMTDGALKYMTANALAENVAQFTTYEYEAHRTLDGGKDGKSGEVGKLAEEGSSQRTYALRSALSAGDSAGQMSWFLIPQNQMSGSKNRERQTEQVSALHEMFNDDRGLEIEMANNDEVLYVDKPFLQQTLKEKAKTIWGLVSGKRYKPVPMALRADDTAREASAVRRIEGSKGKEGFGGADLLAVTQAPRERTLGKTLRLSDLKSALGAKEGDEGAAYSSLPVQDKMTDAQSVRLSDQVQDAARAALKKWLKNHPEEISKIRMADDDGEYLMPDSQGGTTPVRGKALKDLKNLAALARIDSGAEPRTFGEKARSGGQRLTDSLSGRDTKDNYGTLVSDLGREIKGDTAEEIIGSARQALQRRIDLAKAQDREDDAWALNQVRATVESDAYLEYANRKLISSMNAYGKNKLSDAQLDAELGLYKSIWEKGVFGTIYNRSVDGKGWDIPKEYQFRDANGNLVTSFRDIQVEALKDLIPGLARGDMRIFHEMKTGGGKTLLIFTLASVFGTMAKMAGREGAIYATTNGDLVAQANTVYRTFFKGAEPPFKIETYNQLSVDQAMAQAMGRLSPFQTHYMIFDEFDHIFTTPPTSLGIDNGDLDFPQINPILEAMRQGAFLAHDAFHDQFGGINLDEKSMAELLQKNPEMRARLDTWSDQTWKNVLKAIRTVYSPAFKSQVLDINSELYRSAQEEGVLPKFSSPKDYQAYFRMTPEQVYEKMRRQTKTAFGEYALPGWLQTVFRWSHAELPMPESLQKITKSRTLPMGLPVDAFAKVGVIERQFGSPQDWVRDNLEGAGIIGSFDPEKLSEVYARGEDVDPTQPTKLYQYHEGGIVDNLDTKHRGAIQLMDPKKRMVYNLKYDNLTVVDAARLCIEARKGGARVIALSGTLSPDIARFLRGQGWAISGVGTTPAPIKYEVVKSGAVAQTLTDQVALDSQAHQAGEKVVSFIYLPNKAWQKKVEVALDEKGVAASRRAVVVTPDSNFQENERLMYQVRDAKNLEALNNGAVDAIEIIGPMGLRGLDIWSRKYSGYKINVYIIGGGDMSKTNVTQFGGRTDPQRTPPGVSVDYTAFIDEASLPESLKQLEGYAEFTPALDEYVSQMQGKAEKRGIQSSGIYDYKAPQLPKVLRFLQKKASRPQAAAKPPATAVTPP